jgi:hypothetical protein
MFPKAPNFLFLIRASITGFRIAFNNDTLTVKLL